MARKIYGFCKINSSIYEWHSEIIKWLAGVFDGLRKLKVGLLFSAIIRYFNFTKENLAIQAMNVTFLSFLKSIYTLKIYTLGNDM